MKKNLETLCIHGGWHPTKGEPQQLPIYQSTTFKYDTSEQMARLFDLEDDELARLHVFAARVARAIKQVIPCVKVGEAVLGLEVPHAHIHLIPMQSEKDMLFSNPKLQLPADEMQAVADAIRGEFEKI